MLDVDGTLAPIVDTPDLARVPDDTRETVGRLTRLEDTTVVLVSGRGAEDAWRVAGVHGVWVIGNHGFETRDPSGLVTADDRALRFDEAIARAASVLERDLRRVRGAIVENKRWTLSVHYRMVDQAHVDDLVARTADVARDDGLRVLHGKKIVELRPPLDIDKGTACVAFIGRIGIGRSTGSVLYAGDDRTDEDAFRELRKAVPGAVTVRVASGAESAEVRSEAELVLRTLPEVRELLDWIAERRAATRRTRA